MCRTFHHVWGHQVHFRSHDWASTIFFKEKCQYLNVTHIWRLYTPACVRSGFLHQFWRKRGFMTPELGQRTSSTVEMLTVKFVCIFHEVQLTIIRILGSSLIINYVSFDIFNPFGLNKQSCKRHDPVHVSESCKQTPSASTRSF